MATKSVADLSRKELLRRIVDELEGVVVSDAEGRYVYVNNRWSAITGYSLDQIKGKYIHDVVKNSMVDEALRSRKNISGHAVLLNAATGEEIPMYCSYNLLYREEELEGCLIYMIQISEQKPLMSSPNVSALFDRLSEYLQEFREIKNTKYTIHNIIGNSPEIVKLKEVINRAARSASTVLIEGETGTGKELVAHAIHTLSDRTVLPFVKVNCAAIPGELLESEFFGYEGGTFTGANRNGKAGKFEMADKGSMFLDEINQLPPLLQPKLLRVLQEKEVERIGSARSIPIDVRIIAATNISLERLISEGSFRSDLYYRLNVIRISIPPLRERKEDIPAIAESLLKRLNFQMQLQIPDISEEALERLREYDWPGNIRELQNVIERAMNFAWCERLEWKHFEDYFSLRDASPKASGESVSNPADLPAGIKQKKRELERKTILDALEKCSGNKAQAAKLLGISRTSLYKKMQTYSIDFNL